MIHSVFFKTVPFDKQNLLTKTVLLLIKFILN